MSTEFGAVLRGVVSPLVLVSAFMLIAGVAGSAADSKSRQRGLAEEREVIRLEHKLQAALESRDSLVLEEVVAPAFVFRGPPITCVFPYGKSSGLVARDRWIRMVTRGEIAFQAAREVRAQVDRDRAFVHVAIVSGREIEDRWIRHASRWRLVSRRPVY